MSISSRRHALRKSPEQLYAEQVEWIKTHGGDLAGYIARYGPRPCRSCGGEQPEACEACLGSGVYTYGDGGAAIFKADTEALEWCRGKLKGR